MRLGSLSAIASLICALCALPASAQSLGSMPAEGTSPDASAGALPANSAAGNAGVVRLRQPGGTSLGLDLDPRARGTQPGWTPPALPVYVPSEFERYVQDQANDKFIRRFGADLMTDLGGLRDVGAMGVPADYALRPGDEVQLTLWGSVDAELRLLVDRTGKISVPRIGAIPVAGVRHADLSDVIARRVATVFKNFQVAATLGQIKNVRVFVTGYAQRPGSLTVSGLSSVLHVLMQAGGPSAAGSFRDVQLRRGNQVVAKLDLYDLLVHGDRKADQIIQADDVIHIGPVGPQVAVIGSVNQAAVFELKPGETLDDALRMAGGFNAVADRTRVGIERLADRSTGRVAEAKLPAEGKQTLASGDLVRVFSGITAALPKERQRKRVRVEGEVLRPGDYILPAGASLADAIQAAGGMTGAAYVFGTDFSRESVRQQQQENYDKALRDLETDMAKSQASQRASTAEEVASRSTASAANAQLIERLRLIKPTGRVVLQLTPDAKELPNLPLEDGDRLLIPSRASSVGVFGSVFNGGSYVYKEGASAGDYLRLAGGPTRGADHRSVFMLRANGAVISARQGATFWGSGLTSFESATVLPGDTIFVPEELNKTTLTQDAKDWTQILYQFGLGLAGIKALGI